MTRPPGLVLAILIGIGLVGCGVHPRAGDPSGVSGNGPLSPQAGGGSTMVGALNAAVRRKTATFGTGLCSTKPDRQIIIDRVRYETQPSSLSVTPYFRLIAPGSAGVIAVRGGPWGKDRHLLAGKISRTVSKPITQSCDDGAPRTELLTVVTVDRRGGLVYGTYIDYHVGSARYTARVRWQVGFCGKAVSGRYASMCRD